MLSFKIAILLISIWICKCSRPDYSKCKSYNQDATVLNSLNGKIQGACYKIPVTTSNKVTTTNNPLLIWLAVPYAKPPTGISTSSLEQFIWANIFLRRKNISLRE